MIVAIPSRRRVKTISTYKLIPDNIPFCIVIDEAEFKNYNKKFPKDILVTHPSLHGMGAIRQFILDYFKTKEKECVVMLDDDITYIFYVPTRKHYTDKKLIGEVLEGTYYTAKELGAQLFGWNNTTIPTAFFEGRPIELTGYINAKSFGITLPTNLFFDSRFIVKEDYDIAALNAYKNRVIFRNEMWSFNNPGTFAKDGGLSEIRNIKIEVEAIGVLRQKYGGVVQQKRGFKPSNAPFQKARETDIFLAIPF